MKKEMAVLQSDASIIQDMAVGPPRNLSPQASIVIWTPCHLEPRGCGFLCCPNRWKDSQGRSTSGCPASTPHAKRLMMGRCILGHLSSGLGAAKLTVVTTFA